MTDLFTHKGAHVLVDGQFGSTGKGALAAWLAAQPDQPEWAGVVSNAGPNSGHTFYHDGEKIVLKQLPTFAVALYLLTGRAPPVFLSAGAVIDEDVLISEALRFPDIAIYVHPNAVRVSAEDKESEHSGTVAAVAGTRSGTGAAIARKVLRDPSAVMLNTMWTRLPANVRMITHDVVFSPFTRPYFVEVSQGFSLGINSRFYPKTTSRECTVSQSLADAQMPPRSVAKTYMTMRTYPIRVGDVDGFDSGGWYPDQKETSWGKLGVEPELTTVTQRIRRVATFSMRQLRDAVRVNDPDFVFMNFMNYLPQHEAESFLRGIEMEGRLNSRQFKVIAGYGPKTGDIHRV